MWLSMFFTNFFFIFQTDKFTLWDLKWVAQLSKIIELIMEKNGSRSPSFLTCRSKIYLSRYQASLVAQRVKNPPAMRETWVQSLGWEDHLEEGMAIHSSILAWRMPWTEEPGGLQSLGSQRVGQTERVSTQSLQPCPPQPYQYPVAACFLK